MSMAHQPWSDEDIAFLEKWQRDGAWHPYTCGGESCRADLIPTREGWICPRCDYKQSWFWRPD